MKNGRMAARDFLRAHWPVVTIAATAVAILAVAFLLLRTMPPRTLVMATGPEGGAYHEIGRRYRELLAREGVTLRLLPTSGALENLALLRDPRSGVGVALIQDGTAGPDQAGDLESLGTVFYEPLWMFYRSELRGDRAAWAARPQGVDRTRGQRHARSVARIAQAQRR